MQKLLSIILPLLCLCGSAAAQKARVQIIHNAPEPVVDIYANGDLLLDNFKFRAATPFLDLPAEVGIEVAIAPENSSSAADALATFPVTFADGKRYVVMAAGVVGNTGATAFNLFVNDAARESASASGNVDVAVFHGSPDAPAVDVDAVFVADNVVSNLGFGKFTGYLELPAAIYDLAIQPAGTNTTVATFRADLSGLAGGAATVFASGFLGAAPGFGLFAALPNGNVVPLGLTPTARVQIIHNAPDPTVDIYAGNTRLLDNFAFRTATPFIDVPADRPLSVGVALPNSNTAADAIANFPVNFAAGKRYVVMAAGVVGNMGATAFNLFVNDAARESASASGNVDVAVFHGSPDAPAVDVDAVFVADNVVSNLGFGKFTGYLELPAAIYDLAIQPAGTNTTVATFRADLSGLAGGAATVFASGFLGAAPGFGLFAALPNGAVVPLGLTPTARVQIIHNAPDPTVDIYAGNTRLLDNFAFRTATPFIDVPADRPLSVGVALPNSNTAADAIANFPVNFAAGKRYVVMAAGVVGNTGATAFNLFVNDAARESANASGNVDVAVFHGSPDAPAVDVDAVFVADNVVSNLGFGKFTGYLELPAAIYDLAIQPAGTNTTVATFRADLSGLAGGAATVFASGFLGAAPGFGLFAALPNGAVVPLGLTPTARVQIIHNAPDPTVDIYAGNTRLLDNFAFRTATPFIDVPADRPLSVGVALPNSNTAADAIANFPVNFAAGKRYVVMAAGVVGNTGATAFNLFVNDAARESASASGNVDVAVFHGSPDAPAVDVDAVFVADNVVSNLGFGKFTGYLELPAAIYDLAIRPANTATVAATFRADLSGLAGGAATVFASGFLGAAPGFGLFAALPNGAVVPLGLTPTARVQIIHNAPSPTVDIYAGNTRLLDNFAFRTATPFIDVPADRPLSVGVALPNSNTAADAIANFPVNFAAGKRYVVMAAGVVGNTGATAFNLFVNDAARESASASGDVDVAVFHGSTDAPAVDIYEYLATAPNAKLVSNLPFGQFTGYLSLSPDIYDLRIEQANSVSSFAPVFRANLSLLAGRALVVFASGFYTGNNPEFGLFAALADGRVIQLRNTPFAEVQLIHNAPDPTVDLYINGSRTLQQVRFRTAWGFTPLPADRSIVLGFAAAGNPDILARFPLRFEANKTYVATASGILGNTGPTAFNLFVKENARSGSGALNTVVVQVFHGSPNAPEVDVILPNGTILFDNLSYGEYSDYITLPPGNYTIYLTPANNNATVLAAYKLNLKDPAQLPFPITTGAFTVFASGLLGGTPSFGLWLATSTGGTFPLETTVSTNTLKEDLEAFSLAPNPATERLFVRFDLNNGMPMRYRIFSASGAMVQEGDWGQVEEGAFGADIQVGDLPQGLYHLEILSPKGSLTARFVVQH